MFVRGLVCAVVMFAPAMAQLQFAELGKQYLPADGFNGPCLASGDIDGDGDLDLLVMDQASAPSFISTAHLYRNDGNATFTDVTAACLPNPGFATRCVAFGDVDGDGDLDLVEGFDRVRLALNNGNGIFADATLARMPATVIVLAGAANSLGLSLRDLDGDGDLDVLSTSASGAFLFRNDGTGTFTDVTASSHLPVAGFRQHVLGDWDRDGDLDLYVAQGSTFPNRLFLNDGTGTFTDVTSTNLLTNTIYSYLMAAGDIDADGDLDLVLVEITASNSTQIRITRNNGSGVFTSAPVMTIPGLAVFAATSLLLADLDGDGDLDLTLGCLGRDRLYLNDGTGTYTDATAGRLFDTDSTYSLVAADFDGDGDIDLVSANRDHQSIRMSLNDGTGVFADATARRLPPVTVPNQITRTRHVAAGDVDGDQDVDIVAGNLAQDWLFLNNGAGVFTDASSQLPIDNDITNDVLLADIDGDHDLDLVVGNQGLSHLLLNDGAGVFADVTTTHMPIAFYDTKALALGDVDGDGDPDLVLGNPNQNRLYLNSGAGVFTDATSTRIPNNTGDTTALALGDLDGDGDLDLLTGGTYGVQLFTNNGVGTFTLTPSPPLHGFVGQAFGLALGDIDGDGDLDLAVGGVGQSKVFRNTAGSFTEVPTPTPTYAQTFGAAFGDLDGDGDLDLILANHVAPHGLYLNSGTGTFTSASSRLPADGDATRMLLPADIDQDGDLDLIAANDGSPCNRVYMNLLRQFDAPLLLQIGRDYRFDAYARFGPAHQIDVVFPFYSPTRIQAALPPLGFLLIDPLSAFDLPVFAVSQPAGVGSMSVPVPNVLALVGIAIHTQALIVQTPLPTLLTNINSDVIGR